MIMIPLDKSNSDTTFNSDSPLQRKVEDDGSSIVAVNGIATDLIATTSSETSPSSSSSPSCSSGNSEEMLKLNSGKNSDNNQPFQAFSCDSHADGTRACDDNVDDDFDDDDSFETTPNPNPLTNLTTIKPKNDKPELDAVGFFRAVSTEQLSSFSERASISGSNESETLTEVRADKHPKIQQRSLSLVMTTTKVASQGEQHHLINELTATTIKLLQTSDSATACDVKAATAASCSSNLKKITSLFNNSTTNNDNLMVAKRDKSSGGRKVLLTKQLIERQLRCINSVIFSKVKLLLVLMTILILSLSFGNEFNLIQNVQAGFWTFYFPNILKPSGYKELTKMIDTREMELNSIKDNYSDNKYFWNLMKQMDEKLKSMFDNDKIFQIYPEESVCSDIFPMFRDMAIEYAEIDYHHYMTPLQTHLEHLLECRTKWFPAGKESKNILPRIWEQELYEKDLIVQIEWAEKLANNEEFREKRRRMVEIYNDIKRSLDTSLPCLYLKYAFRQVSEDINQLALEMNINAMKGALNMVRSAYKRIEKYHDKDNIAIEAINDDMKRKTRMDIKS